MFTHCHKRQTFDVKSTVVVRGYLRWLLVVVYVTLITFSSYSAENLLYMLVGNATVLSYADLHIIKLCDIKETVFGAQ